jgi:phospholipase/lecithinase/hemolysin
MKKHKLSAFVVALGLAIVAGCGGGGGSGSSISSITSVKVMGDSLSDSGAFHGIPSAQDGLGTGRIFSVQSSPGVTTQIWTERIAALVGDSQLCNYFQQAGTSAPQAGCASFAVGGSRINNRYKTGLEGSDPFSVTKQMATAASLGNFKASDLLLIDGGGNDAADLFGAYLNAAADGGAAFAGIVTSTLSPVTAINTALAGLDLATAGTLYMQTLADEFYNSIKTNALDKGATHVTVLNIPAITKTPRFQRVLAGVELQTSAAGRAGAELLANTWIKAYNERLASKLSADSRVVVVDFYTAFLDQVAHPSQYGLTNVTDTACPQTGTDTDNLPTYTFETCTAANLSATAGKSSPDWWKTYAFSDGFHPTPYGYQLMSQLVSRSLAQAGWIK